MVFNENEFLVLRKSLRIRIWDLEKWRMQLAESGLDVSSVNFEIDSLEAIFEKLGGRNNERSDFEPKRSINS